MKIATVKDALSKLPPAWWGAAAGAMVAGAQLVPSHRVLAGLAGGAAMLYLAVRIASPCCADCAKSTSGGASAGALTDAGAMHAAGASSCGGLDEAYS